MASLWNRRVRPLLAVPFVQNIAKFQVGTTASLAISLLASVIYTRLLGLEGFGVYALSGAFAGLLSMFASFGQEITMTTFVSEAVGKRDEVQLKTSLRYFLQASLVSSVVFIVLGIVAPILAPLFQSDEKTATFAQLILFNSALQFPSVLLFLALQIGKRIGLLTTLETLRNALQLLLATIFLFQGFGVSGILWGQLIVSAVYFPMVMILYDRFAQRIRFPKIQQLLADLRNGGTWGYFVQGFWITLDKNITSNLHPNIFFIMLNAMSSVEVVGLVRLAHRLAMLPGSLILPGLSRVSAVTIPKLIAQDRKAFKGAALKLIFGSLALSAATVAGAMIVVPPLIPFVFGPEYSGATPAFLILVLLNLFTFSHILSIPLLRLYRKIGANILNFVVGLGIAVFLYWYLSQHISDLLAASFAILYVHVHGILIYFYLWYAITHKTLQKR